MARIKGTGIVTPSKDASKKSTAFLSNFQKKADERFIKTYEQKQEGGIRNSDFETDRYNKLKQKYGDQFSSDASETFERRDFFSMTKDPRNEVKVASANIGTDEGFNQFVQKDFGISTDSSTYQSFPNFIKGDLRQQYKDSLKFKEGTQINQAPEKKENPTIGERVASFTGGVFNALTGTQSAVAQTKETGEGLFSKNVPSDAYSTTIKPQYQINREQNRPLTSSNLDAAKAVQRTVDTGDTSFSSYRMGGGDQQQEGSGIVTPFSQTSMGKGESRKVTPFSETSMGQLGSIPKTSITTPKTVTVDGQKVAARQTVASLPSNYKATEAEAFRKAAAFQEAKKIAQRNPNVKVGVDSKGQPVARAVQKTRDEAGASARTAAGNQARVKQNAQARAQAAAVNRKLSGRSISQTKAANKASMRASAAARNASFQARKKAGTLSRSERTASGQRARNKAKARARAQSAARKRRAKKRGRKGKKCDIFLKYNISPLTNMNLIRDDLAEVAYFVKEIQK